MFVIFRRLSGKAAIDKDAAQLIREFGQNAFSVAGDRSWREDAGLMVTRSPGHWHRVQQEIGRRLAHAPADMPALDIMTGREPAERMAGLQ